MSCFGPPLGSAPLDRWNPWMPRSKQVPHAIEIEQQPAHSVAPLREPNAPLRDRSGNPHSAKYNKHIGRFLPGWVLRCP